LKAVPATKGNPMGKRHKNLYHQICHPDTLWDAYKKASAGKRRSLGYLHFKQHEAANIAKLSASLLDGSYQPGEQRRFTVYEPKRREISALPFSDRVVQHALVSVIDPIFDKSFLPQSFACRVNKGTHRGAMAAQALMRRMQKKGSGWFLKIDFASYFKNINREILHKELCRKISCQPTLDLISKFHPSAGTGLPIGNLTSQLFANVYGHILDRHLVHELGRTKFIRYMDDTVIFSNSRHYLETLRYGLKWFCKSVLKLDFSRWMIAPFQQGLNFLGYRIWTTHKLLRRSSVARAKKTIRRLHGQPEKLRKFVASWRGHAQWADSHNLLHSLEVLA
jgi:RNA-directed DNA polymerase